MRKKYAVTLFYPNLAVGLRLSTPVLLGVENHSRRCKRFRILLRV